MTRFESSRGHQGRAPASISYKRRAAAGATALGLEVGVKPGSGGASEADGEHHAADDLILRALVGGVVVIAQSD